MYLQSHDIHNVTDITIGRLQNKKGRSKGRQYQTIAIMVFTGEDYQTITLYSKDETLNIDNKL